MKIVHIYARNLQVFNDALEGTGCRINGSQDINYMLKSISNYNARDVMGLVVFRQHMTKRTLRLVKEFDSLFVFNPLPVVVICDDAYELYEEGLLKLENCPLFCVNSVDGTISDVDIQRIFTTLSVLSDTMYDLSAFDSNRSQKAADGSALVASGEQSLLADEVLAELEELKKGVLPAYADQCPVPTGP